MGRGREGFDLGLRGCDGRGLAGLWRDGDAGGDAGWRRKGLDGCFWKAGGGDEGWEGAGDDGLGRLCGCV